MCAGLFCAEGARAQQSVTEVQSFPIERLRLSTTRSGILDVESGAVAEHLAWAVGLWTGYERNPLVLYRLSDGQRVGALVSDRVGSNLSGSVGLYGWFELGLEAPVVLYQARPSDLPGALEPGSQLTALSATDLGDLRIMGKVRLLRQEELGVNLALIPAVTLPTGGARGYSGEAGAVFSPELAASSQLGPLRLGANVGAVIRPRTEVMNQIVESELTAHFGVAYRFNEADSRALPLELDASLSGAVSAASPFASANQTHTELRAMAVYDAGRVLQLMAGGGVGLAHGWGTPDFRMFVAVRFSAPGQAAPRQPAVQPAAAQPAAAQQAAPGQPEVQPAAAQRPAPQQPAVQPAVAEQPAPKEPAVQPAAAQQPAPPRDSDGDGVVDRLDSCPDQSGPVENRGCPDTDRDGDGIVDRLDNCPDQKGTPENHGCAVKQLVVLTANRIEILEAVYFKTAKAIIERRSYPLLDNVAAVLASHPEVSKVLVEGHTDNQGNAGHNLDLSDRRAQAVAHYLAGKGIASERLVPKGFGQTQPIADNKTAKGREKNRRVVFTIQSDAAAAGVSDGAAPASIQKPTEPTRLPKKDPAAKRSRHGGGSR